MVSDIIYVNSASDVEITQCIPYLRGLSCALILYHYFLVSLTKVIE